jgi:hypothetical protein
MTDPVLRAVLFLLGGYAALLVTLFEAALIRGWRKRREQERTARILPRIQETLGGYLAGNNDLNLLREFQRSHPTQLSAGILSFRHVVSGSARDRLCELSLQLNLAYTWRDQTRTRDRAARREAYSALAFISAYEPCRPVTLIPLTDALDDFDRQVRIIAAQAMAQYGNRETVARVFGMATRETLLGRILLTEQLRPHAIELCAEALPAALQSKKAEQLLGALQIVVGWERALPLPGLEAHIRHPQRLIRIEALRAAALVMPTPQLEEAVTDALSDPDGEVAMAAVAAAARLRLQKALPMLARCVRTGDAALARTAAAALAALPPVGWSTLAELSKMEEAVAAGAAAEALGRLRAAGAG